MVKNLQIESEEKDRGEELSQLLEIAENSQDAIIGESLDCVITSWNNGAVKMFGYSAEEMIGKSCSLLIPPEFKDEMKMLINKIISGEAVIDYDSVRLRKDGSKINVSLSISPVHSEDGTIVGISIVESDVTKLKWYENRIHRISRLYEALGKCNQAIAHCTTEEELYEQVCAILVQTGGMVVVWVGLIDETSKYINVAYSFGNGKEHLSDVHLSVNENDPFGSGPTGVSLRENRPVWSNDFMHDPTTKPWHELAEKVNLHASVSFPLVKNGVPIGNISLYSDITNVFDNETKKIIIEIVADINLALDNFTNKNKIKDYEESLLRIQTIVENSHDAIIGETLNGTILSWNNGAVKMFGYTAEEAIGKSALILFPPEIKAELPKLLDKIRAGERITDYDSIRVYKDGSKINVSISVAPVYSVDKIIVGASIIIRDITERKMLENAVLKVSTDKYKKLFMSSRDAVMTLEAPTWNFTSGNPATIQMFRAKDEADFLFHGPWSLSPEFQPDGRRSDEKAKEMIEKAMNEGSNFFEWTHKRLDGEEFPAEVLLSRVQQNGNGFLHALVRDITDRKKAEEALNQVNLVVENSRDGIFSESLDGTILSWNNGAAKMFGYSGEDIIGKSVSILLPPEMKGEMQIMLGKIKAGEVIIDHDSVKVRKDGTKIDISHSISPIKNINGTIIGVSVVERDITERKKIEKKLEEYEEEKFKVIFDNAVDGILIADIATKHFHIGNPAISKMLGYSLEEISKLNVSDIHPKEDLPHVSEVFEKQMKGDLITANNIRVKRKDGSIFYCDITSSLIVLAGRRYLLGVFRDVTKRKIGEEDLLRSEANLKEAQRIGHFGYFDWNIDTHTMIWSDEYYRIHGLEPKEKTPNYEEHLKMHTPESAALFDVSVKKCLETGEPFEIDMEQIRPDGTKIWTTVRGEARRDKNNKIIGLHGTAQDITDRKQIEFEREQFLKFFILSSDIMVIADPNGAFKKINPTCLKILGYSVEELLSKPFIDFVHPDDKQSTLDEMARQIKKGSSLNFENRYLCKDGTSILLSWNATYDKSTGITYATARDITEQKEDQQHIKELNEVRHKFLEIISHQLRTPLTSVNWNLEAILDGDFGKLEDTTRRFLQFTHKASVEITQRIHDLLSAMDIEEGYMRLDKEETALDSLVASVVNQMKIKCEFKNISYQYIPPEKTLPVMDLDTVKIRIVISKIIENAITYTKENGKIVVSLKQLNENVRFEVVDNGIGIPESEQHYIFDRFFRASNASVMQTDAFGVGLFIVKAFIEQHGGTIGFKSKEGEGSTFWFELPI